MVTWFDCHANAGLGEFKGDCGQRLNNTLVPHLLSDVFGSESLIVPHIFVRSPVEQLLDNPIITFICA